MKLLKRDAIIFDRFQVSGSPKGSGQSLGYPGTDLQAHINLPWQRLVFLKQYHDIFPGSEEAKNIQMHYNKLKDRLTGDGKRSENFVCLPIYIGIESNSIIAVYPWIQNETLRDLMDAGITQAECIRIAIALIKTIRWLHKQEIVHLDLKPSNVIVKKNIQKDRYYIRLIDFDAALIDNKGGRNVIIGTENYMSPEHCKPERFGRVSFKSDIFTLGIMLFELLFKKHPLDNIENHTQAIISKSFSIPPNNYHYEIVEAVIQCLSPYPIQRPSAGKLLRIFNDHFPNSLEAAQPDQKWPRLSSRSSLNKELNTSDFVASSGFAPLYVQIEIIGNKFFKRTYFESTDVDSLQLRGSSLERVAEPIFSLLFDVDGCNLFVLSDTIDITLENRKISKGDYIPLGSVQQISIGTISFIFRVGKY